MVRQISIKFSIILLCLIPFSLLTGPFYPDLFVSIIGLIFIFISIKEKLWKYYKNKFFILFIFFYFYILLRSIFSEFPMASLESSLFYFRFGFFSLAVWFLINNNKKLIKIFTICILITFLIALADGIYQYIYNINIFGIYIPGVTRMTLLLNDKMILGGYLARLFPFLLALLIYDIKKNKIKLLFLSIILVITDSLVYVTGERTALALLLMETILVLILLTNFRKLRLITFIISLLIILGITFSSTDIKERNINHTINQVYLDNGLKFFSIEHQDLFTTAKNMYTDNPIFGLGPKLFRVYCNDELYGNKEYRCSTHPHNTYLQVAAELGTVGLIFILFVFSYVLIKLYQKIKANIYGDEAKISDYQTCLLICFIVSLWPIFPTQSMFNNWISVIYYLPVGFYLHSLYDKNSIK